MCRFRYTANLYKIKQVKIQRKITKKRFMDLQ